MDKADVKRIKESGVFGPMTFWITEVRNLGDAVNDGVRQRRSQCVHMPVRVCVRACVRACARVCVNLSLWHTATL